MNKDIHKLYKRKVDNKMKCYGETDLEKKTIRINKKMSKKNPSRIRPVNKGASRYADVLDTIVHEESHVKHPRMLEKNIRKKALSMVKKLTRKQKQKYYARFS